jgi:hypothetical protein
MAKPYVVSLSETERLVLQDTIKKGKASARAIARTRILRKADCGRENQEWTDTKIAGAVEGSGPTVEQLRKRVVLDGVDADGEPLPVVRATPRLPTRPGH